MLALYQHSEIRYLLAKRLEDLVRQKASQSTTYEWPGQSEQVKAVRGKISRSLTKEKAKTKGLSTASVSVDEMDLVPLTEALPSASVDPHFTLSSKSMTLLDQIYPPKGERATTSITWQDFLSMMVDIGFSIETNGGSAHSFTMKEFSRINVHRPHPDSTLLTYHLRNIGTHLEKQFGLQRQNFKDA
jgi:hypothetical protein